MTATGLYNYNVIFTINVVYTQHITTTMKVIFATTSYILCHLLIIYQKTTMNN